MSPHCLEVTVLIGRRTPTTDQCLRWFKPRSALSTVVDFDQEGISTCLEITTGRS